MSEKHNHLIEFYGETCPHCIVMRPVIEKIEDELGIKIDKKEVWNNEENRLFMEKYFDQLSEACGGMPGVPSFINTKTNQALCGEHEDKTIKLWATGADCSNNVCKPHTKLAKK
ncbi:MAG: thioredoxin family protein [bacterium]|nr:thioredoxin family protein [bacterium]